LANVNQKAMLQKALQIYYQNSSHVENTDLHLKINRSKPLLETQTFEDVFPEMADTQNSLL